LSSTNGLLLCCPVQVPPLKCWDFGQTRATELDAFSIRFELSVDEPIDSAYIKIALPHSIKGAKVGYPAENIFGTSESAKMQVWEMGRDLGGECDVIQAAINSTEGVSFVATANVLAIRTSNLEARGAISGAIAVTSFDSAMRSEDPIFEGSYQYTKWGIPVRRKLSFHYAGVKDAK